MSLKIPLTVAAFFSCLDAIKKTLCFKPQAGRRSVYMFVIISLGNQEEVVDQLIICCWLPVCHLITVFQWSEISRFQIEKMSFSLCLLVKNVNVEQKYVLEGQCIVRVSLLSRGSLCCVFLKNHGLRPHFNVFQQHHSHKHKQNTPCQNTE